jgi:glutamate N-acetyltransferase/amino-acid N-acetyltransferase
VSVTYPKGFVAAGTTAGFKPSGQPDLGLLIGQAGTVAAGAFTTNRAAAAPVLLGRKRLRAGTARGVLVNSGQADELVPCSTGVIGEPLHLPELLQAAPALVSGLSEEGGDTFARAIMTTDTVPKVATADAGSVRVGGCAKGVGMIAPSLATMLAFVTTDATVASEGLARLMHEELVPRFNALTVDACSSTNDTVLLFASGASGATLTEPGTPAWERVARAIGEVGESLVRQLAADAEGGNHVLIVDVEGAASVQDARTVARAVAESPLVKAAAFGGDPNPGRIVQAVGSSGADVVAEAVSIAIGGVELVHAGVIAPAYFANDPIADLARAAMKESEIEVAVAVGTGPGRARAFGCDLSYEYVRINGEYTT